MSLRAASSWFLRSCLVPAVLVLGALRSAHAQDQFVLLDETYTATSANTMDSHFRRPPRAGTPTNLRAPIDYASGTVYVELQVLEKPSTKKTLYNVCFEAPVSYACMSYPDAYTAPGLYPFDEKFITFYNNSTVNWSMGIRQIALILKDENEKKMQGSPDFYPTKIHITITLVPPGGKYVPPSGAQDAGAPTTDAATPSDAGRPRDASAAADAPQTGDTGPELADAAMGEPDTGALVPPRELDASVRADAGSATSVDAGAIAPRDAGAPGAPDASLAKDAGSAKPPNVEEAEDEEDGEGGCATAPGQKRSGGSFGLHWLLGAAALLQAVRRASARRK